MNGEEFTNTCEYCIHKEYCALYDDSAGEDGCLAFEPKDIWEEMSYHRYPAKTMQQRLREGE